MDILLTLVASVLLIIGFFVICRVVDDEDDEEEDSNDASNPATQPETPKHGTPPS